jgi:hypothetical protein
MSNIKKLDTGLILNGLTKIAYDNGTSIYIQNNARNGFEAQDHIDFDALVYADPNKPKVYVTNLATEFDWKAKYDAFMKGEFPEEITFTKEESAVLATLKSIEDKIKAAFALPTIPYTPLEGIDVKKLFKGVSDEGVAEYTAWLNGEGNSPSVPYGLGNYGIFLRLHTTKGGSQFIYNSNTSGYNTYKIGVKTFIKFFNETLKPRWAGETTRQYGPNVSGYSTTIRDHSVDIGCQRSIPRSEIERIAKQLGLL